MMAIFIFVQSMRLVISSYSNSYAATKFMKVSPTACQFCSMVGRRTRNFDIGTAIKDLVDRIVFMLRFVLLLFGACYHHSFAPYRFATLPATPEGTSSESAASVFLICSSPPSFLLLLLLPEQILRISVEETWLYLGSPSM